MPDERLLQIALHEVGGLTHEGLAALSAELDTRSIDSAVRVAVESQTRDLSRRDVDELVAAIRKQPCPECGQTRRPLNGGEVADAKSFVLFTTFDSHTAVACPDCLARRAKRSAVVTALFGWWGIPWGPFYSVKALRRDIRTIRQRDRDDPSDALRTFVEEQPGVATMIASSGPTISQAEQAVSAGWIAASTNSRDG